MDSSNGLLSDSGFDSGKSNLSVPGSSNIVASAARNKDSGASSPQNGMDPAGAEMLASELDSLDISLDKPGSVTQPNLSLTGSPARDKLTLNVGDRANQVCEQSCDQQVQSDWVLLDCSYGIPLFHADVNRQVCERVASHGLFSRDR